MKFFFIVSAFISFALQVRSQDITTFPQKKRFENKLKPVIVPEKKLRDTNKITFKSLIDAYGLKDLQPGVYAHTTTKGRVYSMMPDNMPCLVPDKNSNAAMPNLQNSRDQLPYMPNAIPRNQRLVPEEKTKPKKD